MINWINDENESVLEKNQTNLSLMEEMKTTIDKQVNKLKALLHEKDDMLEYIEKLEVEVQSRTEKNAQLAAYIEEMNTCAGTTSDSQELEDSLKYINELEQQQKKMESKITDLQTALKEVLEEPIFIKETTNN